MKRLLFTLSLIFCCQSSLANALPKSFHNACKVNAFSQLMTWMQGKEMYSLKSVDDSEKVDSSGQQAAAVVLHFDDAKGCSDRRLIADCFDAGEYMAIFFALTDCKAQTQTLFINRQ